MYPNTLYPVQGPQYGYSYSPIMQTQPRYDSWQPGMRGTLTWNAEGVSDPASQYFTGRLHHPTDASGVTIGRGYDMRERTYNDIFTDLTSSGLDADRAAMYARGAKLTGYGADRFVQHYASGPVLPSEVEQRLFALEYARMEADVQRICNKADVVQTYGATDWENLNPAIKELLVDLRYRGDYTPASRKLIQRSVAANDVQALAEFMSVRESWASVPAERFRMRTEFMQNAL